MVKIIFSDSDFKKMIFGESRAAFSGLKSSISPFYSLGVSLSQSIRVMILPFE